MSSPVARERAHRLGPERLDQIFETVLQLVADRGFDAVTMDAISEATHCSKATIYRQWGDKTGLVVAALNHTHTDEDIPNTGSLRGDLRKAVAIGYPKIAGRSLLLMALLHASARHPDLAAALNDDQRRSNGSFFDVVIGRAVERGELEADCPGIPYVPMLLISRLVFNDDACANEPGLDAFLDFVDDVILPMLGVGHHDGALTPA